MKQFLTAVGRSALVILTVLALVVWVLWFYSQFAG